MEDSDVGQALIYQSESGQTRLEVRLSGETVCLTQAQMAELFQTSADNISLHLKNQEQPFDCRLVFTLSVGTHNFGAY